jgi:hypothetical protein
MAIGGLPTILAQMTVQGRSLQEITAETKNR